MWGSTLHQSLDLLTAGDFLTWNHGRYGWGASLETEEMSFYIEVGFNEIRFFHASSLRLFSMEDD